MRINELFSKDIFRPINGVVKAEQQDSASVYQELEEFVITKELREHLDKFISVYLDALDNPQNVLWAVRRLCRGTKPNYYCA